MGLELLPERLRYLSTYLAQRRMNPLFPVSVPGGLALFAGHTKSLLDVPAGSHGATAAARRRRLLT